MQIEIAYIFKNELTTCLEYKFYPVCPYNRGKCTLHVYETCAIYTA